jgi:hypothetical protein
MRLRCAAEGWVHNVQETEQAGRDLFGEHYLHCVSKTCLLNPGASRAVVDIPGCASPSRWIRRNRIKEMGQNLTPIGSRRPETRCRLLQKGQKGTWRNYYLPG